MTFTVPDLAAVAFPAQAGLDAGDLTVLAAAAALTGVQSGCAVTAQGTPNMTVAVAAGVARVGGRRVVVAGGNVTITTADATNPRHDLITADTAGALAAVAGTPAAITTTSEPVFAAIPAGRVVLASVYVPAAAAAVNTNQITDKRVGILDPGYEDPTWYGADPTGAADSTAAFQAARAALPTVTVWSTAPAVVGKPGSTGTGTSATFPIGTIRLTAGTYKIGTSGDIGNLGSFVSIIGTGHNACVIDYRGATEAFRAYNTVRPATDTFFEESGMAGKYDGFTVGGENAAAGAAGLHIGDAEGYILGDDLYIRNFNKAGSRGLWLDNTYSWTESIRGKATLIDCTTCVEMSAGNGSVVQNGFIGGDASFMYNDLTFKIYTFEQQNGVVLSNGAVYQGGTLRIYANMKNNTAATTNALLTVTGQCPAGHLMAGAFSQFWNTYMEIHAESDGPAGNKPQTIKYGDPFKNGIYAFGMLTFNGAWLASNYTLASSFAAATFQFGGYIVGDSNLSVSGTVFQSTAAQVYAQTTMFSDGGVVAVGGDYTTLTLTQNIAVYFQRVPTGPQRRTFLIRQAASGGPYTVGWPAGVYFTGGAPSMSTAPGALDVFFLETYDGTTWYGRVYQDVENVAGAAPQRTAGVNKDPGATTATTYGTAAPALTATASSADDASGALLNHATTASSGNASGVISAFTVTRRDWSPQLTCAVKTGAAADITTVRLQVGLFSASPDAAPGTIHAAYFRYDTGVDGTAFWRTCTAAGGAPTVTTTAVAVAAATRYLLEVAATATAVSFFINGQWVATHTATLPAATTLLGYGARVTTLSANIRNLKWGWLQLAQV